MVVRVSQVVSLAIGAFMTKKRLRLVSRLGHMPRNRSIKIEGEYEH
jgi:hypothetical protein